MASGTTNFDNTIGVDAIVSYSGGAVALPASVTATTINAAANGGTIAAAEPGTTRTTAGAFAPTFASGYMLMNISGTNTAFTLTTTGLVIGGRYDVINKTVPASGTYTFTASAGTFYQGQSAGTVLKFAAARQAVTFRVLSATEFQILSNAGTVVIA